ncbi:hypothetical protein AVEN_181613-1 [Araneus ventricosus]|uniref:Uncharacterized protein n=1 Tax=Araneus ventricosus TaxID=182803 RepID=A0A4Y2CMR2_ARAVE|nr:hypothetical protein AVEN_181613-1 [Araneus ventricosus]
MPRTTPELAPPSPSFRTIPAGDAWPTTYDLTCNRPDIQRISGESRIRVEGDEASLLIRSAAGMECRQRMPGDEPPAPLSREHPQPGGTPDETVLLLTSPHLCSDQANNNFDFAYPKWSSAYPQGYAYHRLGTWSSPEVPKLWYAYPRGYVVEPVKDTRKQRW